MNPLVRRLLVALVVVLAALWLGSLRDTDVVPADGTTPSSGARAPAVVASGTR